VRGTALAVAQIILGLVQKFPEYLRKMQIMTRRNHSRCEKNQTRVQEKPFTGTFSVSNTQNNTCNVGTAKWLGSERRSSQWARRNRAGTSQCVMRHNTRSKLTHYGDHRMALNRQGRTLVVTQIVAAWKSVTQ
jgi:hypothetical protein